MKKSTVILFSGIFLVCIQARAQETRPSGLILPSKAELAAFEEKYAIPVASLGAPIPSRVVNSTYLPPVANGSQGQGPEGQIVQRRFGHWVWLLSGVTIERHGPL